MDLTAGQLAQFHRDGYVFLPEMFTAAEAAVLRAEADTIYAMDREEVWRESSGAPRTAFAAHTYSEPFRRSTVRRERAADVRWGPSLCRERLDFSPLRRD